MSYAALPAVVKQALDASEYAGYRVDDVDHYVTSAEEYYRLELESVMPFSISDSMIRAPAYFIGT